MRIAPFLALACSSLGLACSSKDAPPSAGSAAGSAATAGSGEGDGAEFVKVARDALVGHRAPAATLEMLDGSKVDLAKDLGHRPIYLKFWATWCVPCREQMPHLESTFRAHGDKLAVYAIDVGIDDPIENVRDFVAKKQLAVPVAIDRDGGIAELFHLNVTPQHVLIDRTGVVRFVGHAVTPELEKMLAAIVSGDAAGGNAAGAGDAAPLVAASAPPPLAFDDGGKLELPLQAPIALTFATLFCDSYIAESRPAIGAACAAHAREVEKQHRAHPGLRWVAVAFPVWTSNDDIADYRKRLGVTVPIAIDHGNAWFRRFGARDSYTTVLLDASGAELGRTSGDGAGLAALLAKAP